MTEHFRRHIGFRARDAEVLGPLVRHGQEPADPAGDGVFGHDGVGQAAKFVQAGLLMRNPELTGVF